MCCVFVYPVGVPLAFFALLYPLRHAWANSDHDALVAGILDGRDGVLTAHSSRPGNLGSPASAAESSFRERYSADVADDGGDDADLVLQRYDKQQKIFVQAQERVPGV